MNRFHTSQRDRPHRARRGHPQLGVAAGDGDEMKRVLLTGMSGVGKSAVLEELAARGYKAADTDYGTVPPTDGLE